MRQPFTSLGILLLFSTSAPAQVPDVTASVVAQSWQYYGEVDGFRAYSFRTTICNIGDAPLDVDPYFDTPVVAKNLFRIADGRIVQLGYGFPVVRVCALNESSCGSCQATACDTLGVGCADTTSISDGSIGWGKWIIDANRGEWPVIPPGPSGDPPVLNGRIQVAIADVGIPGAIYVAENQVVSGHDQQAGSGANNLSWREVDLSNPTSPINVGPTNVGEPAIFAWRAEHVGVLIDEASLVDEGGPGLHGTFWVASRATDLGNGRWRYDYAVQNTTSQVAARGLRIPAPCGTGDLSNPQFFGVRHHSGSPFSNAPWSFNAGANAMRWSTESFTANPDANAVRWGNLYAFSVESDAPPHEANARVQLFEQPGTLRAKVLAPRPSPCHSPGTLNPSRSGPPIGP